MNELLHITVHSLAASVCCIHYCTLLYSVCMLYALGVLYTTLHYCTLHCCVVVVNTLLLTYYCAHPCPVGVLYSPVLCITSRAPLVKSLHQEFVHPAIGTNLLWRPLALALAWLETYTGIQSHLHQGIHGVTFRNGTSYTML